MNKYPSLEKLQEVRKMSKLFPTQEIGSLKKPAVMLKKVKDPNVSDEEKIKVRNDAALLNIKTLRILDSTLFMTVSTSCRNV